MSTIIEETIDLEVSLIGDNSFTTTPVSYQELKGDKGDTGLTGPAGPQGLTGIQGPIGPEGPQGFKGDTGAKGDIGPIGPEGPQGLKGDKGDQGIPGVTDLATTSEAGLMSPADKTKLDTGTGLNADTLDGLNSNSFFRNGDSVLSMNNNDGFSYNDSTNVMSVVKDATSYELWDSGNMKVSTNIASANGGVADSKGYTQIGNTLIQFGRVDITPSAVNVPTNKTVTFDIPYTNVPYVTISASTSAPGTIVLGASALSITTSNFVACLTRTNIVNTSLYWQAIGYKA